jgi:hypothetical protein
VLTLTLPPPLLDPPFLSLAALAAYHPL